MKRLKIYVAGKMRAHSHYDSHTWRDELLEELHKKTGLSFISLDPTKVQKDYSDPELVFGSDVYMISQVDLVLVYLSDDISVGGSQEILIAKYFGKPVIGLAPYGGKFQRKSEVIAGQKIKDYKHPFVFSTCDKVCADGDELAEAIKEIDKITPKTIKLIDAAKQRFEEKHSQNQLYEEHLIG